jgi:hypothetical protein
MACMSPAAAFSMCVRGIRATVGFYGANNLWVTLRDFNDEDQAAGWVSYLNGGDHPRKPWSAETI